MWLPLCLLSLTPLQQSIERELTYTLTQSTSTEVTPGIGTSFTHPPNFVEARIDFAIPTGDGVHLRSVFVEGRFSGTRVLDVTALDANGSTISGSISDGRAICGGGCGWGPSEYSSFGNSLGSNQVLGAGESAVYTGGLNSCGSASCGGSENYTESSFQWDLVVSSPSFLTYVNVSPGMLFGNDTAGDPTPFQLNAFRSTMSATSTVITRHELDAAPLTEYCTSPPGSTGVPATLAAFGSQQEGTEYLTIRAEDLPPSSFAILCVATAAVSTPMGSYNVCVGGVIRRGGGVQPTVGGSADFHIELDRQVLGETVHLQSLFRDPLIGVGASNASSFVVQPR